ncbi:MAG: LysM peptidoglycan-binding domain-containing M23 family metallopeptidase [Candidatus Omnitrophica bacterium]|nr:LysM peptidoglycan-binding domain-containing M23 family metallopeptidase [Candidatus Omnitrophota bacterium]
MKAGIKTILIVILILASGCSTRQKPNNLLPLVVISPETKGEYYIVKRGETLWSIAKCYAVNLDQLANFNRIDNAKSIEVGQKIFIPDEMRMNSENSQCKPGSLFDWPYKGEIVLGFNEQKQDVLNQGIDILAKQGNAISAAAAGNIVFTSQNLRGYGKTIIIAHNNDFVTVYSNNNENLVKTGDFVRQGQVIAKAGSTGRASSCLVHFELRKKNKPQNPILYLP